MRVFDECKRLLDDHFISHNGKPLVPELATFKPKENATLQPLFRGDVEVPIDPLDGKPSMLLFGLKDEENLEDTNAHKFLERTGQGFMPGALYATSGGGKTRSLFESLSRYTEAVQC